MVDELQVFGLSLSVLFLDLDHLVLQSVAIGRRLAPAEGRVVEVGTMVDLSFGFLRLVLNFSQVISVRWIVETHDSLSLEVLSHHPRFVRSFRACGLQQLIRIMRQSQAFLLVLLP